MGERRGSLLTKIANMKRSRQAAFHLIRANICSIIPISLFDRPEFLAIDKEGCGTLKLFLATSVLSK